MKTEINQYYYEKGVKTTKLGKLTDTKEPKGVFVARKTNKGNVVVGCSFLRGDDVFDAKVGLNIARKNASRSKKSTRPMTEKQREAYDIFLKRVNKYFRLDDTEAYTQAYDHDHFFADVDTNPPSNSNPFSSKDINQMADFILQVIKSIPRQ
jgi:hypothetical protein